MKSIYRHLFGILTTMVLYGCSSIECSLNGQVLCHYTILDADSKEDVVTCPLTVTFLQTAFDCDTVYINHSTNVKAFDLPMSNAAETDMFAITLNVDENTTVADTVYVKKTNEPWFESVDCAARYNHKIEHVSSTHNFIDTLIVSNPKVSNDPTVKNINICLRRSY